MQHLFLKVTVILFTFVVTNSFGASDTLEVQKLFQSAQILHEQQQTDTALFLLQKALTKSKALKYRSGMSSINRILGDVYLSKSDHDRAQQYYQAALHYAVPNDSAFKASVLSGLAISYHLQGDYIWGLEHFQKAIVLSKEERQARMYCNMGSICNDIQESGKAIYYFEKAAALADKYNDYLLQVDIWNNKAAAYATKKDWEEADHCFREALTLANKYNFEDCKQLTYSNMGVFAMDNQQPDKAIEYLLIAKSIPVSMHPVFRNQVFVNLGWAYLEKRNYDSALFYLKTAISTAELIKSPLWLSQAHGYIAHAYKGLGYYQQAFEHLFLSKTISDSLNKKEKITAANRIETRFRTAQKDREIAENRLLINKQQASLYTKNVGIALAAFALLTLAVVMALFKRNYRQKQALKDEKLQRVLKQQELNQIKAMMNGEERERSRIARELHDGIMVHLSASRMHLNALVNNGAQAAVYPAVLHPIIEELRVVSEDLRRTAHNLMPDLLLEEGLAEALYYFCNSIKKGGGLNIQYNLMSDIPRFLPEFELSVYRIIQELLQNVIKHAQASEVYIQLNFDNNLLNIVLEDNGIGMDMNTTEQSLGMGLKSIRSRLSSLQGRMEIDSSQEGTSINIEFDLGQQVGAVYALST